MKCPYIEKCEVGVTGDFATRICHAPSHTNCHHFCKIRGNLKTALEWGKLWDEKRKKVLDEAWRNGKVKYKSDRDK